MLQFENKYFLFAFLLIPVMAALYLLAIRWKKNARRKLGDEMIISRMMPMTSTTKHLMRFILFYISFIFIIIGLINPQIGSKLEEIKREGSDIVVCLDVSNSMMAEDFSPNRLQKATQSIEKLIDKLTDDRLGIIVFAGEAYVQLPITSDFGSAKLFLESINCDAVAVQGTVISSAIELAMKSFGTEEGKNKSIIIISDGESHDDDAISAAKEAAQKGVMINTVGIGTPGGVPIPYYKNNVKMGYRKDRQGNTVVTKLNESGLKEIAQAGNGVYVRANQSEIGLFSILNQINKLDKKGFTEKIYTDYEDRFQIFIGIALLLLLIVELTSDRKSIRWEKLISTNNSSLTKSSTKK